MSGKEIISRKDAKEKGLTKYFTGNPCKYGHVADRYVSNCRCAECESIRNSSDEMKEYQKQWYQENCDKVLERVKQYRQENRDKMLAYQKQYYEENRGKVLEQHKQWREENPEYFKQYSQENKEHRNEYCRNRYAEDESFKTSQICRAMLKRTLKATSSTKDSRTHELLGYCNEQLKENIESKFLEGMSWDNYGEWHMDHAYPVSRYVQDGVEDPAIINALDNLILMWSAHNIEKNTRTLEEYLQECPDKYELYGHFLKGV